MEKKRLDDVWVSSKKEIAFDYSLKGEVFILFLHAVFGLSHNPRVSTPVPYFVHYTPSLLMAYIILSLVNKRLIKSSFV